MKSEALQQYAVSEEMSKYDLGVGVVTIYHLNNQMSYMVMAEYHNKGALSPTVGARITEGQSIYDVIKEAFARKRLGEMEFESGEIDAENIYYATNTKQNFARLTFVQNVTVDLSAKEFKEKYIVPMHHEAQQQRSVSEFFWKLDETVNPIRSESKFKFQSAAERAQAATKAIENIQSSRFPVTKEIMTKLIALQNEKYTWDDAALPLAFFGKNGGRKYSELTGFYLLSLLSLLPQLKTPNIKTAKSEQDKATVFIEHPSLTKAAPGKHFFIFEDEIKTIAAIMYQLVSNQTNTPTVFKPTVISKKIADLESPWTVSKIDCNQFKLLNEPPVFTPSY